MTFKINDEYEVYPHTYSCPVLSNMGKPNNFVTDKKRKDLFRTSSFSERSTYLPIEVI